MEDFPYLVAQQCIYAVRSNTTYLEKLERERLASLGKVDQEYYDHNSPHYRNNERYSWAVKSINKTFEKLKQEANEKI